MVMARSCGLTSVAASLAALLGVKENSMRQRMREWYYEKGRKRGRRRSEIDVSCSFVPLLRWVVSWWPTHEKRLALAMDATSLGQTFVVLVLSVVYRGCAIPIAWHVLRAEQEGSWKGVWLDLFAHFEGILSPDWVVIVMADRGLYASWLWKAIKKCQWHPFLRIHNRFHFRHKDGRAARGMYRALHNPGHTWVGNGTCFKTNPIETTLLIQWLEGYEGPWIVLTDLPKEQAQASWYGMRSWIECGFRCLKSAGFQWQYTRMQDPQRATRFWLALAVATLWILSVGGQVDADLPACSLQALPARHIARRTSSGIPPLRSVSCFQRGLISILAALIGQRPIPPGRFALQPWPT